MDVGLDADGQLRFEESLERWQRELRPLADALDDAENITADDLAITITKCDQYRTELHE